MNCFHFTFNRLKALGYNIPETWNNYTYDNESKLIDKNPEYYLENNIHKEYFKSFCNVVKTPLKNDIIVHRFGIGLALNETHFITLNHLQQIKINPIRKKNCEILRVCNG